jgi:hypothetical protein
MHDHFVGYNLSFSAKLGNESYETIGTYKMNNNNTVGKTWTAAKMRSADSLKLEQFTSTDQYYQCFLSTNEGIVFYSSSTNDITTNPTLEDMGSLILY